VTYIQYSDLIITTTSAITAVINGFGDFYSLRAEQARKSAPNVQESTANNNTKFNTIFI